MRVHQRAFTLIEAVIGVAMTALIMVGMGSAMLIAAYTVPNRPQAADASRRMLQVTDELAEDLGGAVWIPEHEAAAITFTVADRDGDNLPERLRYSWSGTAGDPLLRQRNGGSPATLLANVKSFGLSYEQQSVSEDLPGPFSAGAESTLISNDRASGLQEFELLDKQWVGQFFRPTLPAGAVRWEITHVKIMLKPDKASSGEKTIELRTATLDGLPSKTVLESVSLGKSELTLLDWQWVDRPVTNVKSLRPGQPLCLVLTNSTQDEKTLVRYFPGNSLASQSYYVDSRDGGETWTATTNKTLLFYIYGKVSVPGPTQTVTRDFITGVGIAMETGGKGAASVATSVRLVNLPEKLSGLWETGFDADPTLDHNGDGTGDWQTRTGAAFNMGDVVDGEWCSTLPLDTAPANDFSKLTTATVRFRNTTKGSTAAKFSLNADWGGGRVAPLSTAISLQADGTQTLTLTNELQSGAFATLAQVFGLPDGMVTMRLLVNPATDSVNLKVDGLDVGTYPYTVRTISTPYQSATIMPVVADAKFDSVSVRVGE